MTARSFHLGDILSVTTGCLVSPRHMDGIYDLLNFMTGDDLFTHQLPRASRECEPHLKAQHPDLADVEVPEFPASAAAKAAVEAWVAEQVVRFGEYHEVTPLPVGDHTRINPLDELAMNYPNITVIPVVVSGKNGGAA